MLTGTMNVRKSLELKPGSCAALPNAPESPIRKIVGARIPG
jgi:hypothetical protein